MPSKGLPLSRRGFLALASGALVLPSCLTSPEAFRGSPRLTARPLVPTQAGVPGLTRLGLGTARDGFLYIPAGYQASQAAPLLVLLHGATGSADFWQTEGLGLLARADARGMVVLAPDSRSTTWDLVLHGHFDEDVAFIESALRLVFDRCRINPSQVALAGFSDGATYALSVGVPNGDLFTHVMGFSPGFYAENERHGKPKVFLSHGIQDAILPIASTSRVIVPRLRDQGYQVEYQEFEGGHVLSVSKLEGALSWFLGVA